MYLYHLLRNFLVKNNIATAWLCVFVSAAPVFQIGIPH